MSTTNSTPTPPLLSFGNAVRSIAKDLQGAIMLGSDGVLRSFDGSFDRNVLDVIRLSPAQIKESLDMQPWSQQVEDKFRGVDGRNVTDPKELFEPSDDKRPPKYTPEERREREEWCRRQNEKLMEDIEQDRKNGVDVREKYSCSRVRSNFNLNPIK